MFYPMHLSGLHVQQVSFSTTGGLLGFFRPFDAVLTRATLDLPTKAKESYWQRDFISDLLIRELFEWAKFKLPVFGRRGDKRDGTDKNITRRNLTSMGQSALLAYALVSNFSTVACFVLALLSHSKAFPGVSPLSSGHWRIIAALYSGIWAANNLLRPLRVSTALALAPCYERAICAVQRRSGLSRARSCWALALTVNGLGTPSLLALGLLGVSWATGTPLIPAQ